LRSSATLLRLTLSLIGVGWLMLASSQRTIF
jgi:hypothetical protein